MVGLITTAPISLGRPGGRKVSARQLLGARLLASSDRRDQDDGWFDWDMLDEIEAHACPTSDPKLSRKERGGGRPPRSVDGQFSEK